MNQIETVARPDAAIENLTNHQQQADMDGTFVKVSRQALDEVLSFIAAMPPVSQWQGIESAPRDGTRMILAKFVGHPAHDTALWWAVAGHWSDKWQNWNDGVEPCGLAGPTHWTPLPTPPAGGSDAD